LGKTDGTSFISANYLQEINVKSNQAHGNFTYAAMSGGSSFTAVHIDVSQVFDFIVSK
jgi:hypothetical protein